MRTLIAMLGAGTVLSTSATVRVRGSARRHHTLALVGSPFHPARTWRGVLGSIGGTASARRLGASPELRRRLDLAGEPASLGEILGMRIVLAGAGAGLLALVAVATPPIVLLVPFGALVGLRSPDLVLARMARRRQRRLAGQVVDLVELLVATTQAGLGPSEAIRRSASALSGPLGRELARVVHQIDLGVAWKDAIEDLTARADSPALRRLAVAMSRSHRLGTPVRAALRTVAQDLREDRRVRAEELARRAPVKMLFPLPWALTSAFRGDAKR